MNQELKALHDLYWDALYLTCTDEVADARKKALAGPNRHKVIAFDKSMESAKQLLRELREA